MTRRKLSDGIDEWLYELMTTKIKTFCVILTLMKPGGVSPRWATFILVGPGTTDSCPVMARSTGPGIPVDSTSPPASTGSHGPYGVSWAWYVGKIWKFSKGIFPIFVMGSIWACSTGATFFLWAIKTSLIEIDKKFCSGIRFYQTQLNISIHAIKLIRIEKT